MTDGLSDLQLPAYDGSATEAAVAAGDYSGAIQNGVFQAQQVIGTSLADYNKAKQVYDAIQDPQSPVDESGQKSKQQLQAQAAAMGVVLTAIGGPLGAGLAAALSAFVAAEGAAHAGAGYCNTDPPSGCDWPSLMAWPHYVSWSARQGTGYPQPASGTFEAYANPILEYNQALRDNCFVDMWRPTPLVLATLIQTWNTLYSGPMRTISRQTMPGDLRAPSPKLWDPIAQALSDSVPVEDGRTVSFQVANGPPKPIKLQKVLTLHFPKTAAQVQAATGAPSGAVHVALQHVLTLHLGTPPQAKLAATAIASTSSPAAQALLGAAHVAISSSPAFWVAYYSQQAETRPLPSSHPFEATIRAELARFYGKAA